MKLQISSQIAIFALLELAGVPERQLAVAEIGEKYGVSSHHLAKVMQVLARAGLVRSVRGAGGGYAFCGNARRTTLLDVIRLQADDAHDPFSVNNRVRGIIMHCPSLLRFKLGIARRRIFDASVLHRLLHLFLAIF